jgi:hypothetical protein
MKTVESVFSLFAVATLMLASEPSAAQPAGQSLIERGRYLVHVAGCNDCHTPGYTAASGKVNEKALAHRRRAGLERPLGHHVRLQSAPLHARAHRSLVADHRTQLPAAPADALVQPARDDRRGPARAVPLHQIPATGWQPGPGLRATGHQARRAGRPVPGLKMAQAREAGGTAAGRPNQKRRTRKDLLLAAARLMKQGRQPVLEEVAEEALVSRAHRLPLLSEYRCAADRGVC